MPVTLPTTWSPFALVDLVGLLSLGAARMKRIDHVGERALAGPRFPARLRDCLADPETSSSAQ